MYTAKDISISVGLILALLTNCRGPEEADHLDALKQIGMRRLNISLDTLNADTFYTITRRRNFEEAVE